MVGSPVVAVVAVAAVAEAPGRRGDALPFRTVRALLAVLVVAALSMPALPATASETGDFPEYTGAEFVALYEYAVANTLPNLELPNRRFEVTGREDLDSRIWEMAFDRGYRLQPYAGPAPLPRVAGVAMQVPAAEAWSQLREEARLAGMGFTVSSAYRSPAAQRTQFLSKLGGTSDSAIDATLTWYSLPGTSKHHAGYALDFRYADGTFGEFRRTKDHAWLSADNFAVPKRYGLIPSYPDDVENQGPNPEPWEYLWVGVGLIRCGLPQQADLTIAGPVSALLDEIERCPGGAQPVSIPRWIQGLSG